MSGKEVPVSLVVRAIDKATHPLEAIEHKLEALNAPGARIGKLFGEIGEHSGFNRLTEGFKGVGEGFLRVGEKAGELTKELALMAVEGGFVAFELVKHFMEIGAAAEETAARLGLTVDQFLSLEYAGKLVGITSEEMTSSLDKFNKNLGEAKMETGALYKVLEHTPPAFKAAVLGASDTSEALQLMFEGMVKIHDPSKRAAFAMEVFGKSGKKMSALVGEGTKGLARARAEFRELAGEQAENAKKAVELHKAFVRVSTAFEGLGMAIAGELFPAFEDLAGIVKDFLVSNRDGVREWAHDTAKAISGWVEGGGFQRLGDMFKRFSDAVSPIVDALGGWPLVLAGIAGAITVGPLLGALASLAAAFGAVGLAILATPLGWALGLLALVAGAATFALAKDEALHQATMRRTKALGEQKAAQDAVTDSQEDLNEALNRSTSTESEINQKREILNANKKWAETAFKAASAAIHDQPSTAEGLAGLAGIDFSGMGKRPSIDASGSRPGRGGTDSAKVMLDIRGAPKGSRLREDPNNTADVDTSLGISNLE